MPGGSRALPDRPNLRYLRLEAKRRLAAGEFATLHDAQTAIAREHGAQLPEIERPPVPSPVANAVKVMYLGAATSILGIIVDILTVNATKSAIERRSHKLTVSQVDAAQHALIVGFIVGGLVGAAAWIFIARNCRGGKNWARITGTVLFAIATIDTTSASPPRWPARSSSGASWSGWSG